MGPQLIDAHCHLDLMAHPDAVADEATALGLGLFDCGVDPRDFSAANERACRQPGIIAGVGLHPWWLADGRCGSTEVDLLCEVAAQERHIGEVGLDFSERFAGSESLQIQALDRLCDVQNRISLEIHQGYVGKTVRVLCDGRDKDLLTARTEGGRLVRFAGDDSLIGQFFDVTITGCTTWSLVGELR